MGIGLHSHRSNPGTGTPGPIDSIRFFVREIRQIFKSRQFAHGVPAAAHGILAGLAVHGAGTVWTKGRRAAAQINGRPLMGPAVPDPDGGPLPASSP